jgi:ribosomal-protein-alanine N-acetyltransferase
MPPHLVLNLSYQTSGINVHKSDQYFIRSMVQTDIPTVFAIDQATWRNEAWPLEHFFAYLDDPFCQCWILESTNTDYPILGYGFQYFSNGISHIANLCIHPNQRGYGLGGILLRHMIDYGRRLGTSIVELEVKTSNINARRLYAKHGFKIIQLLEKYYSNTDDGYRMQLIINRID